jgi:hypothetical protein
MIKAAILSGYTPKVDGTVTIRFNTQELTPQEVMELHSKLNSYGILYFREGDKPMNQEELKELDAIDLDLYDEPKSQSQRIRNVMYVWWEQKGKQGEFKEFYKDKTEQIIEQIKSKLE